MTKRTCRDCGGPLDILHTKIECEDLQQVGELPEVDRYHLSVIAAIIDGSPSAMAAAYRLYLDGFLRAPRTAQ